MARLLYIEASPRKERSKSIEVARVFTTEYRRSHPGDTVDLLDLWQTELPAFTGEVIDAKYAILHGLRHTAEQQEAWSAVEAVIENFKSADKYLFSLPMWNFGIPYRLKHFIDTLIQPTYTFETTPEGGYKGLVTGKPAALVYARGGAYPAGTAAEDFDYQKRYMELILGFIGFTDVRPIVVEPTLRGSAEEQARVIEAAKARALEVAAGF